MPILLDLPDGDRQPTHRSSVAGAVQPVEASLGAHVREQRANGFAERFLDRVFGHNRHLAAAPSCTSPNIAGETLGEGQP